MTRATSERPDETGRSELTTEAPDRRRLQALARLGLAVGAAYLAPTVLSIDRSARAMGPSCSSSNSKACR